MAATGRPFVTAWQSNSSLFLHIRLQVCLNLPAFQLTELRRLQFIPSATAHAINAKILSRISCFEIESWLKIVNALNFKIPSVACQVLETNHYILVSANYIACPNYLFLSFLLFLVLLLLVII
jgi:hypothetical protein